MREGDPGLRADIFQLRNGAIYALGRFGSWRKRPRDGVPHPLRADLADSQYRHDENQQDRLHERLTGHVWLLDWPRL